MLADFCVRLALGMTACLLLLSPAASARPPQGQRPLAHPNFFRTQCLTVLALAVGSLLWLWGSAETALLGCLAGAAALAFLGSVTWSVERSPGAVSLIVLTVALLGLAVGLREGEGGRIVGAMGSAALLGAAVSAMLMGHSYLIAPAMSLVPLFRLLGALFVALALRAAIDGWALLQWTADHSLGNLNGDNLLWLPVRWLVGLLAPLVLGWMAWQTARIRSTQSATGILYVVVIFCFLGELTGQLLRPDGLTW
jgi:hypothetical protein